MNNALETVSRFANALDHEDYATVAEILAAGCVYVTPKGIVRGREDIVASYRAAGVSAKAALDRVGYESAVVAGSDGEMIVTFIDRLEHRGYRHIYSCEQVVYLDLQGHVGRIVHRELPGQREGLDLFLLKSGSNLNG